MAHLLLANISLHPTRPSKKSSCSIRSFDDQFVTPHQSFTRSISSTTPTPSDEIRLIETSSSSTSTTTTLSESSSQRSSGKSSQGEISMVLNNDVAEFFVVKVPNRSNSSTEKRPRKRDRVRSALHRKFHRSQSSDSDDTMTQRSDGNVDWSELLADVLISVHRDVDMILSGLHQVDGTPIEPARSRSFFERRRAKFSMIQMAHLLSSDLQQSTYPYTDIVESHDHHLNRMMKQLPRENRFIQCKPFQHRKCRYRIQRSLLRIRHDYRRLKVFLYGKKSLRSDHEIPSMRIHDYRVRLERNVFKVRRQMAEYDLICSSDDKMRFDLQQAIDKMKAIDLETASKIEDYRTKIRAVEYAIKDPQRHLISAPFIPRRRQRSNQSDTMKSNEENQPIFIDLQQQVEEFFGEEEAFWNRPDPPARSSLSISIPHSNDRRRSSSIKFPMKLGLFSRIAVSFAQAQQQMRENQEFYDCSSSVELVNHFDRTSLPYYSMDLSEKF